MTKLQLLRCNPSRALQCAQKLSNDLQKKALVQLLGSNTKRESIPKSLLKEGPGVVISSGGSSGGPHQCLQPCSNLDQSALSTGLWLQAQGIEPTKCSILNPLPLNHISGLISWWRSRQWEAQHTWLLPSLMRDPVELERSCQRLFKEKNKHFLVSLVPTQLSRLIHHPAGWQWLQKFDVIWVGGASLSENLGKTARNKNLRLAPCYGSTETAAMVTALTPEEFLKGQAGCGSPLTDVELALGNNGELKVRTPRIAKYRWKNGAVDVLVDNKGWWISGDRAELIGASHAPQLRVIGRIDTAINSGGETVFPEKLEAELLESAKAAKLPIDHLLLLPVEDKEWGQRLVGLVCWRGESLQNKSTEKLILLKELIETWQPAEKPVAWFKCQELCPNSAGKMERQRWSRWLRENYKQH